MSHILYIYTPCASSECEQHPLESHAPESEPLPVRVDFTKPFPLKATISPCPASSPGGAVVP